MKKFILLLIVIFSADNLLALMEFGAEEIVQASDVNIDVGMFSTPSFFDWNNDGLDDLIIGDGTGKVRIFLNNGTITEPAFSSSFFAQANGSDLQVAPSGCLGAFPRVVNWNNDSKKDLLVGSGTGSISIFINNGTDSNPVFSAGVFVKDGPTDISVGGRATSIYTDWNNDGMNDLVSGAYDGKIRAFINEGSASIPVFQTETFAKIGNDHLTVPSIRSSPIFYDFDDDGKKDLICGNTDGNLLFYKNTNTLDAPVFSNFEKLQSLGSDIYLPGTEPRSRPSFCNWNNGVFVDVLIGATDGQVHLFRGIPEPSMILLFFIFLTGIIKNYVLP